MSKKNLTSGKPISNSLTAEEACRILEACSTHNVSKIQFGDLYVEFGVKERATNQSQHSESLSQEQHDSQNASQIKQDAAELRRREIDELILTDPEKYEELLGDQQKYNELLAQGEI